MFFLSSQAYAPSSPFFAPAPKQPPRPAHHNSYPQAHYQESYAPSSPSPLRTQRNVNIMSSPIRGSGFKSAGSLLTSSPLTSSPLKGGFEDTENWAGIESEESGFHRAVQQTPVGKVNTVVGTGMGLGGYGFDGEASSLPTPPASASHPLQVRSNATDSSPFTFTAQQISTTRPSQWSLRSRESSPSVQLTTHTARNREDRKSKFLDRIRRRRDDERSEVVGDQVLRMDFVKERRGWEESMAQRAIIESLAELEDEEDDIAPEMVEDEEMSPTEEYDDLVREFERGGGGQEDDFLIDDVDDEEYERLFREMEILSQQSQSQSQNQPQAEQHRNQRSGPQQTHQLRTDDGGGDDTMDVS